MRACLLVLCCFLLSAHCALDKRWTLLFEDNFNGNALDTTKWTARDQGGYQNNGEFEYNSPSQVSVSDGKLVIKSEPMSSRVVSGYTYNFSSGYLDTSGKFSTSYGRYEINARLPYGHSMWPAHWLVSQTKCWPVGAEIDIMESISKPVTSIHGTYHFGACCGCNSGNGSEYNTNLDLSQGYHTFGVEWWPGNISWFFDNITYKVIKNDSFNGGKPFAMDRSPHFIILNSAVGGWWPGAPDGTSVWPQYHYVDYVRVYGWQPCITGCGHGCCDGASQTCVCDAGYMGTNCEYTETGDKYDNAFQTATANDELQDNAVINNGLTLSVRACCTNSYIGGFWTTAGAYGEGNFTYKVKSVKVSGTAMLLIGVGGGSAYTGFQLALSNNNNIGLQTWINGQQNTSYRSFALGFDPSAGFNTYQMVFGDQKYSLYINGKFIVQVPAATIPLQMQIKYEYSTQYYGSFNATPPVSVSASGVSWISSGKKAVCTGSPTTATTAKSSSTSSQASTSSPTTQQATTSTKSSSSSSASASTEQGTTDPSTTKGATTSASPSSSGISSSSSVSPATTTSATTSPSAEGEGSLVSPCVFMVVLSFVAVWIGL